MVLSEEQKEFIREKAEEIASMELEDLQAENEARKIKKLAKDKEIKMLKEAEEQQTLSDLKEAEKQKLEAMARPVKVKGLDISLKCHRCKALIPPHNVRFKMFVLNGKEVMGIVGDCQACIPKSEHSQNYGQGKAVTFTELGFRRSNEYSDLKAWSLMA